MYRGGNERQNRNVFLKPGNFLEKKISESTNLDDDSNLIREEKSEDTNTNYIYNNPYLSMSIQQQRARLPIFKVFYL